MPRTDPKNKDMRIEEIIVVEGRDDTAAVKKSVDAITIETHGYGITEETWELMETAYRSKGLIVFTDPDSAGERIRRRITERFPNAAQAFLDREDAERKGDIGIENAAPGAIREALAKARRAEEAADSKPLFTMEDLMEAGLTDRADSSARRKALGKLLGIGYGNGKAFLGKLNRFGITKESFFKALEEIK